MCANIELLFTLFSVKQGDLFFLTLFALYINDLLAEIEPAGIEVRLPDLQRVLLFTQMVI